MRNTINWGHLNKLLPCHSNKLPYFSIKKKKNTTTTTTALPTCHFTETVKH
jgi:hypothetical protein